jgi:hypothetical protein
MQSMGSDGQPGMFFEIDALHIFHVPGQPADPETEAVADQQADAGDDPHCREVKSHLRTLGSWCVAFIARFAAGFDEIELGLVHALLLGRIIAEPGEEKETQTTPSKPAAQKPSRQEGICASQWRPGVRR